MIEDLSQYLVAAVGLGTLSAFIWALMHEADRAAVLGEFRGTPAVVICWGLALFSFALWFVWAGTDGWVPTGKAWAPMFIFGGLGLYFYERGLKRPLRIHRHSELPQNYLGRPSMEANCTSTRKIHPDVEHFKSSRQSGK